ncbi:hypothetical protein C8Q77DRAFT_153425 [Trametes polyzona]|nr:hypothetical protein C8Q77DRAFT_153425 [Trametes polyzona]
MFGRHPPFLLVLVLASRPRTAMLMYPASLPSIYQPTSILGSLVQTRTTCWTHPCRISVLVLAAVPDHPACQSVPACRDRSHLRRPRRLCSHSTTSRLGSKMTSYRVSSPQTLVSQVLVLMLPIRIVPTLNILRFLGPTQRPVRCTRDRVLIAYLTCNFEAVISTSCRADAVGYDRVKHLQTGLCSYASSSSFPRLSPLSTRAPSTQLKLTMSLLDDFRRIVEPLSVATPPPSESAGSSSSTSPQPRDPLFLHGEEMLEVPNDISASDDPTSALMLQPRINLRRSREEDPLENGEISTHLTKRLKGYGTSLCSTLGLEHGCLDEFVELPTMAHMLVDMKAHLFYMQKVNLRNKLLETVATEKFQQGLQSRLAACLLSPNLTAYIHGVVPKIMELISADPVAMRVEPEMVEFPDVLAAISAVLPKLLARVRGQIKEKLLLSLGTDRVLAVLRAIGGKTAKASRARILNVAELSTALVPRKLPLEVTSALWARVALLRRFLVKFNSQIVNGTIVVSLNPEGPEENSGPGIQAPDATAARGAQAPNTTAGGAPNAAAAGGAQAPNAVAGGAPATATAAATDGAEAEAPQEDEPEYGVREFWVFVDAQLTSMHAHLRTKHATRPEQLNAWKTYLTAKLQDDLAKYKGDTNPGLKPVNTCRAAVWQRTIEKHMV